MGSKKWTEDHFRNRLRTERERLEWTQDELAAKLTARGIQMHWTTVAKIERGTRSVRIDEATAIATLLGVSLDSLAGRTAESDNALEYTARAAMDAAREAVWQLSAVSTTLINRFRDLAALEFDGSDQVHSEMNCVRTALTEATEALNRLTAIPLPRGGVRLMDEAIDRAAAEKLRNIIRDVESQQEGRKP